MIDNQNLHFNVNGFCAISASILSFRFDEKIINKQQSQFQGRLEDPPLAYLAQFAFFQKISFYNFRNWKSGQMEAKKEDFFDWQV